MTKKGKGWTLAGTYNSKKNAVRRASELRGKFDHATVQKGTKGEAWFKPRTVYRVWVK